MKQHFLILLLFFKISSSCYADRFYIINSPGYNTAEAQLITAIINNGHTVVVDSVIFVSLPLGFTSTCVDSVNGYDWLCFFGNNNFSGMLPQIQAFIDVGGKVFYQYEVSCCTNSSTSAADILSGLTGLNITPNANPYIGLNFGAGWAASNIGCCTTFMGNAYKGLDGLPVINQLQATNTLPGGMPPITTCLNFGFVFTTDDFIGAAHQGAIVGVGDVNFWYNGDEPFSNGGVTPINTAVVDYFFPNSASPCYLLPPGCITVNPVLAVYLGNDTALCQGNSLLLNANISNATYQWQDSSSGSTFTVTQPGTYWVTVTLNGCGKTDTIQVSYLPGPVFDLGNDTSLCTGDTMMLDVTTANGTYLWHDSSTGPSYTLTQPGTYWVNVSVNNCSSSDTLHVSYNTYPLVNIGDDTTICQGSALVLDASTANGSYLWQDNTSGPVFTVIQQGTYWVTVTVNNCGSTDSILVNYKPAPVADIGNDTLLCPGASLILDATGTNAVYQWQNGSQDPIFMVSGQGTYWVTVTVNDCSATDSINVSYKTVPVVDLGVDTSICEGSSILLDATNLNASYLWQDGSSAATLSPSTAGTYWVEVTADQCIASDTLRIDNTDCEVQLQMPNVFTPNGDGINDLYLPVVIKGIQNGSIVIYNRWGAKMYESSDLQAGWNGKFKNAYCPGGDYYWFIHYTGINYHEDKISGFLTLIR